MERLDIGVFLGNRVLVRSFASGEFSGSASLVRVIAQSCIKLGPLRDSPLLLHHTT